MKNETVVAAAKGTSAFFFRPLSKNNKKHLQTIRRFAEVPLSAAMTLEASIALPLFIFFFLNIMSAICIVQIQSEMEAPLHQTGNELALSGFDINVGKEILTGAQTESFGKLEKGSMGIYASKKVRESLGDRLDSSPVIDGVNSLNFLPSSLLQDDDIIDIVVNYKVHPVVNVIGFKGFSVESRYYGHAWTGYSISGGIGADGYEEEMVYVTEHGEVFHRDTGCKHLKPSIKSIDYKELATERNADRGKYYPCEYCGQGIHGGSVFVTTFGNRYHGRVDCPGVKRKIYTVPISEVGGKSPCSACG